MCMHADARCDLGIAVVKRDAAVVDMAHHAQHVVEGVHAAEETIGHVAAGGELHLEILQVKARSPGTARGCRRGRSASA